MTDSKTPKCDRCKGDMTLDAVEAVMAPPAPTMYLKKYRCDTCSPRKDKS